MTALLDIKGYEGRGAGIKIKDSANSATNPSNREWFIGSGYSQSGFNIGYSATGSQSSYSAQAIMQLSTSGNATFSGTIAASNLSGTNTGDQTLPTLSSLGALPLAGGTMTGELIGTTASFTGGGNTLILKKGTGNAALTFAGTAADPEASALIEGIAGGGMKFYTSNGGTLGTPAWAARLTISATGTATFANSLSASNLSGTNTGDQTLSSLGALPLAGGTMTGDIILGDGIKASFGTGSDLNIYHNGTNGIIQNLTGGLYLLGSGGEVLSLFVKDGPSVLYFNNAVKFQTSATGVTVTGALAASTATFSIVDTLAVTIDEALIKNGKNIDVDSAAAETVITVEGISTYTAAFFDFVIKNGTNVRAGTVYSCHDGTNVEFTETSTVDLGDTSDVSLSVDISGTNMRLRATTTSDNWIVKSLVRAI
jgi:hypothetical protein